LKKFLTSGIIRTIALVVVIIGAVCSLCLMFHAGRHTPVLLLILFVGWVLSPFIGLLIANKISKHWSVPTRATIYCLMLVLTLVSLVSYSGALTPPGTRPAFIFLIVPLTSWLFILTVIPIARKLSRNSTKNLN
jgi:hypothetical protein